MRRAGLTLTSLLAVLAACGTYGEGAAPDGGATPGSPDASLDDGVFVAPEGRDFAEGTRSAPVATFRRALEIAEARPGATIFACAGTYAQNVVIDRPAYVVGNRSCKDWSLTTQRARIAPPQDVALRIVRAGRVLVEDVDVVATADPLRPGSSAIGVFVSESQDVTLRRMAIRAGSGLDGHDASGGTNAVTDALRGLDASGPVAGLGRSCLCADGTTSTGGSGAQSGSAPTSGSSQPAVGGPNAGQTGALCVNGGPGVNGASVGGGPAGGASAPLIVTAAGIEAKAGANGKNGTPGQGGGGGGASSADGTAGGAGGCGGCGGAGGRGGASGGSSIALLSFVAEVHIEDSTLLAGDGSRGGRGADGEAGQPGADGGNGVCSGGRGGDGSRAGGGGGGAGGHSIGIGYVGAEPVATSTTFTTGRAGDGGAGGTGAPDGAGGAKGIAGSVAGL